MNHLVSDKKEEKKIFLIIDDEEEIYNFFRDFAHENGWEVDWAKNSREAWEKFQAKKYNIIFIDIKIGEENGLDILKKFREKDPYRSLYVMMTGKATPQEIHESYTEAGAYTCLRKPFSVQRLKKLIDMMLQIDVKEFYHSKHKVEKRVSASLISQYIFALILTLIAAFVFVYYNYNYTPSKKDSFFMYLMKKVQQIEGYLDRDEQRELERSIKP